MINLNEELIPLRKSGIKFPGIRPHANTLRKWAASGKLETVRVGLRTYTTTSAIAKFIQSCNPRTEVSVNA